MRAVPLQFDPTAPTSESSHQRVFPTGEDVVFTNYAKTALERIVQREQLAGDTILLPALLIRECFEAIFDEYDIEPLFVDVDPRTYHLDFAEARRHVDDADAVLLLHTYGVPAAGVRWRRLATNHDVLLIEDCARALGATVGGRPVGGFGDYAVFSLHKVTPLVKGGALVGSVDGNALESAGASLGDVHPFLPKPVRSVTATAYRCVRRLVDDADAERAVDEWNHSLCELDRLNELLFYYHLRFGFAERVRRNVELARHIRSALDSHGFEFQSTPRGTCPFHYVSIVAPGRRDEIVHRLRSADLPVRTLWQSPLPTAYVGPRRIADRYPRTRKLMETGLQLPLFEMDEADVRQAIAVLTDVGVDATV